MPDLEEAARENESSRVDVTKLTRMERDVLNLSARGHGVVAVAEMLGWPPEAVRSAIRSASDRLGAHSKLETVIIAIRRGLIDLAAP